ncbi:MAG: bifunctional pyr operon transcriptional regulator/uracil phosphoribosyltransferase PyrR [Nevskiales bacterium]
MTELKEINIPALLDQMAVELKTLLAGATDPVIVGIPTGGLWVAEALQKKLGLATPVGCLNISFHRDDFDRAGLAHEVQPSRLPFEVRDRCVVLVDDVLYTGRSIRAALNEIFDYARPSAVYLAVLFDRGGRELPIQADVVGAHITLPADQEVKLTGPEPLGLQLVQREAPP